MKIQVNREVGPSVPLHDNTIASRLRAFTRMNPPMFFESKFDEEPQDFSYEVDKILYAMGVTSIEKEELAAYQPKDVALTWYTQLRDNKALRGGLVTWRTPRGHFLIGYFLER